MTLARRLGSALGVELCLPRTLPPSTDVLDALATTLARDGLVVVRDVAAAGDRHDRAWMDAVRSALDKDVALQGRLGRPDCEGETTRFVNRRLARRVGGVRPELVYPHGWRTGDVVLWDPRLVAISAAEPTPAPVAAVATAGAR